MERNSARISLATQIVLAGATVTGFFAGSPSKPSMLLTILGIQLAMQGFLIAVYTYVVVSGCRFRAYYRYLYWFVVFPVTLLSATYAFEFVRDPFVTVQEVHEQHAGKLLFVLGLTECTLVLNLLAAVGALDAWIALPSSTVVLVTLFWVCLYEFASSSATAFSMYALLFVSQSLFQVAATLPAASQSVLYSYADALFSGGYGTLLTLYAVQRNNS